MIIAAVVAAFNQEKAPTTNLRMELFEALSPSLLAAAQPLQHSQLMAGDENWKCQKM